MRNIPLQVSLTIEFATCKSLFFSGAIGLFVVTDVTSVVGYVVHL